MTDSHTSQPLASKIEDQLVKGDKTLDAELIRSISAEEKLAVFETIQDLIHQPSSRSVEKDRLYIEQQLSDWTGWEVTTQLDGWSLPYSFGKMKSLPHLKRHPLDQLTDHQSVLHAGMSQRRSYFGWFTESGNLFPNSIRREEFFISLPLQYVPEWSLRNTELIEWYRGRKVIVVNPYDQIAVVCSVGDIGPYHALRYQMGGSPELITAGKIWSLRAQGRVAVFFINDQDNSVKLGPVEI